jgi:DNA-binding NtrC family response regulator
MLNILLVDDEPDVRISLGQVLREEGHAVDMVADAETALARLSAHPFDLVVSDVKLPKLDGLSLLKRVRGEFPATQVLLMTAYGTISDAVTAMKDSAMDYLTKPFDLDVLVTAVGRVETQRRCGERQWDGAHPRRGHGRVRKRDHPAHGARRGRTPSARGQDAGHLAQEPVEEAHEVRAADAPASVI